MLAVIMVMLLMLMGMQAFATIGTSAVLAKKLTPVGATSGAIADDCDDGADAGAHDGGDVLIQLHAVKLIIMMLLLRLRSCTL